MLWIVWNPPFLLITSQLQLSATGPWLNASESDGWMPVFSSTPKKTAQVFGRSDAVQWFCKKKKKQLNCSLSQCVFCWLNTSKFQVFQLVSFILIHIFALPLVVGESCQGFPAARFDDDSSSLLKSVARWYFRYSCFPMFGNKLQQFGMPTENSHVLKKKRPFRKKINRPTIGFQGRC